MLVLLVYATVLLLAVLVSELAHRSVLSTAVMFLAAGVGAASFGVLKVGADQAVVAQFSELALVTILFTDGARAGWPDLRAAWRLPGRALLLGLPLTFVGNAVAAKYLIGLGWDEAMLAGAILSPTDPVFAAAIVGSEQVPLRLRHLLNVESGMNDGLALPVVLVLLGRLGGAADVVPIHAALVQVVAGVAIGLAVPVAALSLERLPVLKVARHYQVVFPFAMFLLVYSFTTLIRVNSFLGCFAAGIALATFGRRQRDVFHPFGDTVAELVKLAALLVFGAMMPGRFIADTTAGEVAFLFAAIVVIRPLALAVALAGSELKGREWVTVAWFGPKGFASVVFGLLVLNSHVPNAQRLFHVVAIVVAGSIVAHSSTDVLVARWFRETSPKAAID